MFSLFLFLSLSSLASVSEGSKSEPQTEKFSIADFLFEEVLDAHSFHILGADLSMPLPVILYTQQGLVFFMSSDFHHDNSGKVIVEKGEQHFVLFHEKIYYASKIANTKGQYLDLDEEGHATNSKPLDFSISKVVFSMMLAMTILIFIFISVSKSYAKNGGKPRGLASWLEPIIIFVRDDIAKPNLKDKHEKYLPYLLTIFFFIWVNNLLGLLPLFPMGGNVTGNIAFTVSLALITFFITNLKGNKQYWSHIANTPGVPWWLKFPIPLIPAIEFVGIFTKPFSLTIRLFANMTAGHFLVGSLLLLGSMFQSYIVGGASSVFLVFILLIELLVGFIQAFIFTILSSLYIGMAISEDHH